MQKAICLQKRDKIQTCKSGSHQFARIGADPKTYFCFGISPKFVDNHRVSSPLKRGEAHPLLVPSPKLPPFVRPGSGGHGACRCLAEGKNKFAERFLPL